LAASAVAAAATAGGWTLAVLVVAAGRPAAPTPTGRSGRGSPDAPAKEALGAGPIAAPTATPIASIAAANAAVTRGEGASSGGFRSLEGDFGPSRGDFCCSGVLSMTSEGSGLLQ
jgi:hypothetical protein